MKESEKRARAAEAVYQANRGAVDRFELLDTFGRLTGRDIWSAAQAAPDELEEAYVNVVDEVNDGSPDDVALADLDQLLVGQARIFAASQNLPWPPGVGDGDRFGERRAERTAELCAVAAPHHSTDLIEVYDGSPEPILLCGYHEQAVGSQEARRRLTTSAAP